MTNEGQSRFARPSWLDLNLALVLAIPFILLLANDEWLFPYGNPSDNWINTSFYLNTFEQFPELYQTYKSSRVSWFLKGQLLNRVFDPLTAHYVLHISMFLAIIFVFYLLFTKMFNKHIAMISCYAIATYSQFHGAISFEWDYQAHDGALHILLALLAMRYAVESPRWRYWLLAAGAAWSVALQTTYLASYMPALVVWYLYLNSKHNKNDLIQSAVCLFVGAVLMTMLMGLFSMAIGGRFIFIANILGAARTFGFHGGFNYHPGYWFSYSDLLRFRMGIILPTISVGIVAMMLGYNLLKRRKGRAIISMNACYLLFLSAFLCALPFHLIGHGQLSNDHIIAFLLPFMLISVAGMFAFFLQTSGMTVKRRSNEAWLFKIGCAALFIFALLTGPGLVTYINNQILLLTGIVFGNTNPTQFYIILCVFGLTLACALGAQIFVRRPYYGYTLGIALSLSLAFTNVATSSIAQHSYALFDECGYRKQQFKAVIETYKKLRSYEISTETRMWYKNAEIGQHTISKCKIPEGKMGQAPTSVDLTALYGAILGLRGYTVVPAGTHRANYLIGTYLATSDFNNIVLQWGYKFENGDTLPAKFYVAVLSNEPEDHKNALNTLRKTGFRAELVEQFDVNHDPVSFKVSVISTARDDRSRAEKRLQSL